MILRNKNTGDGHAVAQNIFTAGSGAVNNLVLHGDNVRKIHFQILRHAGQFRLIAMNGTVEVNGSLLGEHLLAHGDEIKAGSEVYVAEIAAEPPASEPVVYAGGDAYERLLEGVIRLLENPDRRKSSEDILTLGMQLMEADGGYLFTLDSGELSLLCAVPEDNESYSHSAVQAALKSGETLIWSGSDGNGEVSLLSIEQKNIHSILVSPFASRAAGKPTGLLYLHRKRPETPFTEPQRKLFARISQVFGAVLGANQARIEQAERIETLREIKGSGDLVYASTEMAKVVEAAERAAGSNVPVLITGETGTGKDVFANFIHARSPRAGKPIIAVNCGAIPEHLIESELFGHEKGAFTGANSERKGRFELADNGTIFLDEVGEMPLSLQAKLLRVLQEQMFERLGGTQTITVNVRVIAATNRSLEECVEQGTFRADLFYRLNVVPVVLPPLRDRREDIPLLLDHFLQESNRMNAREVRLSSSVVQLLCGYTWPGNVRELQNLIERLVIMADRDTIVSRELPSYITAEPEAESLSAPSCRLVAPSPEGILADEPLPTSAAHKSLKDMEKEEVEGALRRHGWVQARAARELGLTQRQMGYRIKKYGIAPPDFFH